MCGGRFSPHHCKQNALNVNAEEAANIMKKGEYAQEREDTRKGNTHKSGKTQTHTAALPLHTLPKDTQELQSFLTGEAKKIRRLEKWKETFQC